MKFWKITGLITSVVVAVLIAKKYKRKSSSTTMSENRYTVDDLMTDQEL
jgi:hypothetical protein